MDAIVARGRVQCKNRGMPPVGLKPDNPKPLTNAETGLSPPLIFGGGVGSDFFKVILLDDNPVGL